MPPFRVAVFTLAIALCAAGCGGETLPKTHEGCVDELQKVLDEGNEILRTVKTKGDVQKHASDLDRLTKRARAIDDQQEKLGKISDEELDRLKSKALNLKKSVLRRQYLILTFPEDVRLELAKHDFRVKGFDTKSESK